MGTPGGFASLTAGLLARKGGAKPAMRPQLYTAQDDLGWNDMGEPPAPRPAKAVPIPIAFGQPADETVPPPPVVAQQAALAETFAGEAVRARAAAGAHGKSAFTLRLDEARHLRLRLMGAHRHRSAQSLVTEALDRFLDDFERGKV
ncbi:MAG: hypothetical protein Q7J32_19340 [Sphingomonadaceae bacterium]|nr:hypothetical protein [Sphingomonadaceae bacterium]